MLSISRGIKLETNKRPISEKSPQNKLIKTFLSNPGDTGGIEGEIRKQFEHKAVKTQHMKTGKAAKGARKRAVVPSESKIRIEKVSNRAAEQRN